MPAVTIEDAIQNELTKSSPRYRDRIGLYIRITKDIINFLSSEKQILFINIPVEELTIDSQQADKYWADFRNAVSLVLRAVARRDTFTPCELAYPGDWYYSNENFILKTGNPNQSYLYLKAVDRDNSVYLKFHDPDNKRFNGGDIQNKSDIIRGARSINRISTLPPQLKNALKDIKGELELLNSIPTIEFENSEFDTVSLICSPRPNINDPYAGKYVLPLVWDGNNADIVALLGDRSFGRDQLQTRINRLDPFGDIKKLIVIGSKPTSYLLQQNPTIVTLSFADMYNYCVPRKTRKKSNDRHSVGAVFVSVEFPWLTERLNELHERLDKHIQNGYIGSDSARHIYNWIRSFLSHIDFSSEKLECLKENVAFVESIADDDEVIEDVQNWIRGLKYTSDTNPKRDYAKSQRVKCLVNLRRSVRKQVAGATGKRIVVDAPIHSGDYTKADVITTILRYVNFTEELYAVYYKGVESGLMRYSQGNYNKDPLFPHPKVDHNVATEQAQNDIFDFSLDDYLVNDDTGHFLDRHYSVEQMVVTFTDGTNESIFGKFAMKIDGKHRICEFDKDGLIVDGKNEPIDPLGKEISYYSQVGSDLFRTLLEQTPIDKYANLWHEKLREYIDRTVVDGDDGKRQFCKKVNISLQVLQRHLNRDWTSKFIRGNKPMKNILKILKEAELINQEEYKYILASRTYYYGSSSKFGSILKNGILSYYVRSEAYKQIMEDLNLPEDITMDKLVSQYLHTKTIQSVNNGR